MMHMEQHGGTYIRKAHGAGGGGGYGIQQYAGVDCIYSGGGQLLVLL